MSSTLTAPEGRIVVGVNGSIWSYAALHWAVEEAATTGRSVETVTVGHTDAPSAALRPAEGLLETLNNNDLLVLGNSGRGRIQDAFLGPVATECVLHAPCPITVVTPDAALHFAPRSSATASHRSRCQTFPSLEP